MKKLKKVPVETPKKKVNGKRKGSKFELKLAHDIADAVGAEYGLYVRRTPGSGSLITRADLWVHSLFRPRFNWFLEAKNRQTVHLENISKSNNEIMKWYLEAARKLKIDPEYDRIDTPVCLVFCRNNMTPMMLVSLEDWSTCFIPSEFEPKVYMEFYYDNERYIAVDWPSYIESVKEYWKDAPSPLKEDKKL